MKERRTGDSFIYLVCAIDVVEAALLGRVLSGSQRILRGDVVVAEVRTERKGEKQDS